MRKAGRQTAAEPAEKLLAEMMAERIHFEKADPRLQSKREHCAKYSALIRALTPEVGQMLADHSRQPLETNLADLLRELPVWYEAQGEPGRIGGENYTSGPNLARAVFLAMADAAHADPQQLARHLDQPWCHADLYQIEKLSATLRAS